MHKEAIDQIPWHLEWPWRIYMRLWSLLPCLISVLRAFVQCNSRKIKSETPTETNVFLIKLWNYIDFFSNINCADLRIQCKIEIEWIMPVFRSKVDPWEQSVMIIIKTALSWQLNLNIICITVATGKKLRKESNSIVLHFQLICRKIVSVPCS